MKRLNIKLLIILGVGFFVTAVGTHFLHGYQLKRNAANLQARADAARDAGDLSEEVRLLQRYVRYRDEDLPALKRLLKVAKEEAINGGDVDPVRLSYVFRGMQRAVGKHPNDEELLRLSVEFSMQIGRLPDAVDSLRQLEAIGKLTPEDSVKFASCETLENRNNEAIDRLSKLIGFNRITEQFDADASAPNQLSAYVLLGRLYQLRIKDRDDTTVPEMIMNKMVETNKDDFNAYLLHSNYVEGTLRAKDVDATEAVHAKLPDIEAAFKLAPEESDVLLAAGNTFRRLSDWDQARRMFEKGIEVDPENRNFYIELAYLEDGRANGREAKQNAIKELDRGLEKMKLDPRLLFLRTNMQLDLGQLADAKRTFGRVSRNLRSVDREFLNARILLLEGNTLEASRLLEKTRVVTVQQPESSEHVRTMKYLIECYSKLGKNDKVESLAKGAPDSSEGKFAQARALTARGKYTEALALFEELWKEDLTEEGRMLVFNHLFQIHIGIQKRLPESQRDWSKMDLLADRYRKSGRLQGAELVNFETLLLMEKGESEKARDMIKQAVLQYPKVSRFWTRLNVLTLDHQEGLRVLERMQANVGDTYSVREAKAYRLARMNPSDVKERLLELLVGIDGFTDAEQRSIKQLIAGHFVALGQRDVAIDLWKKIRDEYNHPVARTVIFELAVESGNVELMDESLDELAAYFGKSSSDWQVASARKLLWMIQNEKVGKDKLSDVRGLIEEASKDRPDWDPIYDLRADTLLLENKLDEAITNLREAYKKNPNNLRYVQKLAQTLMAAGRADLAQPYLKMLPDDRKTEQDVRNEIILEARQDPKKALERAKTLISTDSKNSADFLFLGGLYEAAGQVDDATQAFKRATEVEPTIPKPWLQYVSVLQRHGKVEQAIATLKDVQANVDPSETPLIMGQCNAITGRLDEAKTWYEKALTSKPNSSIVMRNLVQLFASQNEQVATDKMLDRIIALSASDSETKRNATWARQQRAVRLGGTGTISDFEQAVQLLEANRNEFGKLDPVDSQVWLSIHANRPEGDLRRKALQKLERLQQERALSANERMILAQVYKGFGRWAEAKQIMVSILTDQPSAPLVAQYVDWLLEKNELPEATRWASKLPENSADGLRLHSIIMVRQGRTKEAYAKLMKLVPKTLPKEQFSLVRDVARMMGVLGKINPAFNKPADQQWRRYLAQHPEGLVDYVPFLFSIPGNDALKTAFDRSDKLIANAIKNKNWSDVLSYANSAIVGLREHQKDLKPDSPHYTTIQNWLNSARTGGADPGNVILKLASVAELRGDLAAVEKNYREFLNLPGIDVIQKGIIQNNLAYLLAITNRGEESLRVIEQAMSVLGVQSDLRDTRAMAYIFNGQHDEAVRELQSIVDAGEGSSQIFFHLAFAKKRAGQSTEAAVALNKAFELGLKLDELSKTERQICQNLMTELNVTPPAADLSLNR